MTAKQLNYISDFKCDSSKCIQNCCLIYTIRIDKNIVELYKKEKPELLDHVIKEKEDRYIIPSNNNGCSLLKNGLCQIHCDHGEKYLPRVCYTYPRCFYRFNGEIFITSNLLCDHLNNSILTTDNAFDWVGVSIERIPEPLEDSLEGKFNGNKNAELINTSNTFVNSIDDTTFSSEEALIRLILIARLFDKIHISQWPLMYKIYLNIINKEKVTSKYNDIDELSGLDKRNFIGPLIHIMLTVNKTRYNSEKIETLLKSVIYCLEKNSPADLRNLYNKLAHSTPLEIILKKYIKVKLAEVIFPICNWNTCSDDLTLISTAYTLFRLILLANSEKLDSFQDLKEIAKIIATLEPSLFLERKKLFKEFESFGFLNSNQLIGTVSQL